MTKTSLRIKQYVGIDVAKDHLDIFIYPDGLLKRIANNNEAITAFAMDILCQYKIASITLESTGGYEKTAIKALKKKWQVNRAHPNYVHNFAKALGKRAKTDLIDSQVIAQYGEFIEGRKSGAPRNVIVDEVLQSMVSRREQVKDMLQAEKNHLEKSDNQLINRGIKASIKLLEKQMLQLEEMTNKHIEKSPEAKHLSAILQSFKGVGVQTSAKIIAFLPELGKLNKKQIAALVGLAPYNNDSGKKQGKRSIYGGRKYIRCSLYMAALVATQYNHVIKKHYDKLIAEGKLFKVAITAVMRKILVILNTMVKLNQNWKFATC